ncbi:MAG: sodium:calcium antiporter [Candidatus Marinimicrobia bacterium]|nr:sodium:calcium antiporter [Candidatus Neomarinimicrobiota bacterium]|tara:strand:- start:7963 stop:8889 length:927 start_codon:yes stop_codon:yes gene_type:complete
MTSFSITIYLLTGTTLLYFGGEFLVKGAKNIARIFGVSPIVVGLTIVAFGTSLPELVVSLVAAISGKEAIAIGNVIGSNIANVGLIVGLTCSLFYVAIEGKDFLRDLNIMIGVSIAFLFILFDGQVSRTEGFILFLGIVTYTFYTFFSNKKTTEEIEESGSTFQNIGLLIIGMLGLYFGSNLFVEGAINLAKILGITDIIIGMTIVAYGTSLPELATSIVAALKKEGDISIGNIIGSNLFNMMGVVGPVAIISPLKAESSIFLFELPIMLAFSLALYPIILKSNIISRKYASILLLGYISFIASLFIL